MSECIKRRISIPMIALFATALFIPACLMLIVGLMGCFIRKIFHLFSFVMTPEELSLEMIDRRGSEQYVSD
jgi:hypothetical protein